jgi:ABC-type glycerol-3-phosphate transport system substrate-binding protein
LEDRNEKTIAFIFLMSIILVLISGCSRNKSLVDEKDAPEENKAIAAGSYKEEDIPFPDGTNPQDYIALAMTPEGTLELYYDRFGSCEVYKLEDGEWQKESSEVLGEFHSYNGGLILKDVFYGEDGKQYLFGYTPEYIQALYRRTEQGEYERIRIPKLEEKDEEDINIYRIRRLKVLENGMIAAMYSSGEIELYSPDELKVVAEYSSTVFGKLAACGNKLYFTDSGKDKLYGINTDALVEEEPILIETKLSDFGIIEVNEEAAYLCDITGIHLHQLRGSIWETLIDDNKSCLSMPTLMIDKFLIGTKDDFYAVMKDDKTRTTYIKHYYFDDTEPLFTPLELSVYSLEENKAIRQAVAEFNRSHPEATLTYRVAKSDKDYILTYGIKDINKTVSDKDYINALNTELLAGKGPDILVMDGMPVNSYIEKGVLEDMSSILNPMLDAGTLLNNIAENYKKDGRIYVMPVRIKLPVIYGSKDAVEASASLKELAAYATTCGEIPLFDATSCRPLAAWCFLLYYDQLLDDKGTIDKVKLASFLENISLLAAQIEVSEDANIIWLSPPSGISYGGHWVISFYNVYKRLVQANLETLNDIVDFGILLEAAAQWEEGDYRIVNHNYEAKGLVAINSSGRNKDLAGEFVRLLFSEQLQGLSGMDGFPINVNALNKWIEKEGDKAGYRDGQDWLEFPYPSIENREDIIRELSKLKKPVLNDTILLNMILDEAERYLKGDITEEQAADNIISSINTYLAE